MTPLDLLRRVRNLMEMGRDLDTAIAETVDFLCETGQAEAALRALAPYALKELERRTLRSSLGQGHGDAQSSTAGQDLHATDAQARSVLPSAAASQRSLATHSTSADGGQGAVGTLRSRAAVGPVRIVARSGPPAIPLGASGRRLPILEWTRREWHFMQGYFGRLAESYRGNWRIARDVLREMGDDGTLTTKDILPRLKTDQRKAILAYGGVKRLGA